MHALHMPPRHFWRLGLIALLLALAMTVAVGELASVELPAIGGDHSAAPAPAEPSSGQPSWVTDPGRPVTFALDR